MLRLACTVLLCILMLSAGCGQKGPLYLPDDTEAERQERARDQRQDDYEDDEFVY